MCPQQIGLFDAGFTWVEEEKSCEACDALTTSAWWHLGVPGNRSNCILPKILEENPGVDLEKIEEKDH